MRAHAPRIASNVCARRGSKRETCAGVQFLVPRPLTSMPPNESTTVLAAPPRAGELASLRFDNAFVRELPGDPETGSRRRQVYGALYSRVDPDAGRRAPAAGVLGRGRGAARHQRGRGALAALRARSSPATRGVDGMEPYAANYGGHQFGSWAGQLGDGRAITLGETINAARRALGAAAQGRGPDAVLAHGRRARGAALVGARVPVQRGDAPPRRPDDARAVPGRDRRERGARHVLRRQPAGRAGRDRVPGRAVVLALRQFRAARLARRPAAARETRRLRHSPRLSGARRRVDGTEGALYVGARRVLRAGVRAHRD